ncbi:MAG: hypothetical protein JXQ73_02195, partial [Phycisphaerae bacterium]|nr:hypothetical protein [Phycisphaerae bacterium]
WVLAKSWRDNIWFKRIGLDVYKSATKGHRIEMRDEVAGWDDNADWIERIRNYRARPIDVEIRRTFPGDIVFRSRLDPKLYDYRTPQFAARIEPSQKKELTYRVTTKQGYNKKQDKVTLVKQQDRGQE